MGVGVGADIFDMYPNRGWVGSKKLGLATDNRNTNYIDTKNRTSAINDNQASFKEKPDDNIEIIEKIDNEFKNLRMKSSKSNKVDDNWFSTVAMKNSIQGIITPVVQISYSQIK